MRKISILTLLAPLAPLAALAQGEGSGATVDFSAAGQAASDIADAYGSFVNTYMVPAAVTIVIAGVVLWLIQRVPRMAGAGKK